jgi:K+ transporter
MLASGSARVLMVCLAAAATVIASQAVITGAFSVPQRVAQPRYLPRLRIAQTPRPDGRADLRAVDQLGAAGLGAAGTRPTAIASVVYR